jgi:DNA-binding transcriptional MerR regulator
MLRIGEFAALSTISIHMLRNYDKIGLLVPQHVDELNGYRYYDKEQLLQANQIIALKSMGFGLDEIKEILLMQQSEVDSFLQLKLQNKLRELARIEDQIRQIQVVMNTDKKSEDYALSIVRKIIAPMWVASFRGKIDSYPEQGVLWGQLDQACKDSGIKIRTEAPAMAVYYGVDESTGLLDVEVQFPLDREYTAKDDLGIFLIPEREVVSLVFKGGYSQIGGINAVVADWLEKNSLEIIGQSFSIYYNSPGNCSDDRAFITELCFPVSEKNKI